MTRNDDPRHSTHAVMTDGTAATPSRLLGALTELAETARRAAQTLGPDIERAAAMVRETVGRGGTLFFCGNGGSAADAQHFAAELVGRFEKERKAWPAVSLTTDTSALTAIGNDYGFERVFARQIEALGKAGDVAIGISTSGKSPNVLRGLEAANERGMTTIALTGRGGEAGKIATHHVAVNEDRTARVQEIHATLLHVICELMEREI